MKKLFIIGNGFDLSHSLPTRYADFREFLRETYPEADEDAGIVPDFSIGHHGDIQFSKGDVVGYLLNLVSRSSQKDWCDFEDALGCLDFEEDFSLLPVELDKDGDRNLWHEAYNNEDLASTLVDCVPMLKELFSDWINTIQINHVKARKPFLALIDPVQDIFLNFNYTKTLETIYKAQNVCHIHGVQGGDIIVGHGEDALFPEDQFSSYIGSEDGLEYIHSVFKKDTVEVIRKHQMFFQGLTANITEIYSYGFSFSKVDQIYIQTICQNINTANVTWYLHNYDFRKHSEYKAIIGNCGFAGRFGTFSA